MPEPQLLSIIEMGGYPDFSDLYRRKGFAPSKVYSIRKAQGWLKKSRPAVVVAEFHFDPDLRDRMSNLESLCAALQRYAPDARLIVFIDKAHRPRLLRMEERYPVFAALDYPIDGALLEGILVKVG
ncbi:MAG: hypothetical protein ABW168_07510 [Sedimenticola sp.]